MTPWVVAFVLSCTGAVVEEPAPAAPSPPTHRLGEGLYNLGGLGPIEALASTKVRAPTRPGVVSNPR